LEIFKSNFTTKLLWASGMFCAVLALASLFACTPAKSRQTVERIPASISPQGKSCPYSPKAKGQTQVNCEKDS